MSRREHKIARDIRILEQKYRRKPMPEPTETDVAYENVVGGGLGGWSEVDPNSKLWQSTYRAYWEDMPSDEPCYLYKGKSLGTSFVHTFEFRLTSIDTNTDTASPLIVGLWYVSVDFGRMGHSETTANIVLWIMESADSTTKFTLYLSHSDDSVNDTSAELDVGTTYYLTITRATDVYTCDIYSDSSRTTLVDSITIDVTGETEEGLTFSYVELTGGLFGNYKPNEISDGWLQNLVFDP